MIDEASAYYILMVKCGAENKALERLREEGFEAVCPSFSIEKRVRRIKGDRLVLVRKPVLDGYMFVEVTSAPNITLLKIVENVLKIVSFAGAPALIGLSEIEKIAKLIEPLKFEEERRAGEWGGRKKDKKRPKGLVVGERVLAVSGKVSIKGLYLGNDWIETDMAGGAIKVNVRNVDLVRDESVEYEEPIRAFG